MYQKIIYISLTLILSACSTTKNIPDSSSLLDGFNIKHNTKNATSDLEDFVRQQPNSNFLFLRKIRLGIYDIAGQDTSKWLTRAIREVGHPPVLFNNSQTSASMNQLKKQLNNQGYLNAEVDTILKVKDKKVFVTYNLKGGTPYIIRNYNYTLSDTSMTRILNHAPVKPLLNKGDAFDMDMMEQERKQITIIMRNAGYFDFSKKYLYFKADTTLNSHEVNLYMDVYPSKNHRPHKRYRLNDVTIISGLDLPDSATDNGGFGRDANIIDIKGIKIIRGKDNFLRNSTILRNNYLRGETYFSDLALNNTYTSYNKIGAIKHINIEFLPSSKDSTKLDATIMLLPTNIHQFSVAVDGTNTAGDFGIAPNISYRHQNLFNGGEEFTVKLKGAYEFMAGRNRRNSGLLNQSYFEYGIETGLSLPIFLFPWLKRDWREWPSATTKFSIGLNNQHRSEYIRQFLNGKISYDWYSSSERLHHELDIIDINYVTMPWLSEWFEKRLYDTDNSLLWASYLDKLISVMAYSLTWTNRKLFLPLRPASILQVSFEIAGTLPRLITSVGKTKKDEYEQKLIMGVDYAEYVKGSIDYSKTFHFSKKHSLAYHVVLGLAYPYGNSFYIPFEKQFFAGGSNSIRGWSTRTLGPGSYKLKYDGDKIDFLEHLGDMKLEFNIENRMKVTKSFELAQFIDAGNIWTLKNYADQPGGLFKFNNFYKEIAIAYGLGVRFDLGFLLLRFDLGTKAYDPGLDLSKRFILFKPKLNHMAWHLAIGYPF
jgi:outer membrane protein assembly factor BamA